MYTCTCTCSLVHYSVQPRLMESHVHVHGVYYTCTCTCSLVNYNLD